MAMRRMSSLLRSTRQLPLCTPAETGVYSQMHALAAAALQGPAALHGITNSLWSRDRHISTSAFLAASIKVPSMGESIEEGTISAILKKEGDSVEMDEAIFQIETDKVTVDVRTPEAGVLDKVMVKEDDTVKVGQELGNVSAGSGKEQTKEKSQTQEKPQKEEKPEKEAKPEQEAGKKPSQEDTTSKPATKVHSDTKDPHSSVEGQSESQPNADAGKVSIRFPRRRTPDGRRISDLPLEEQQQYREQEAPQQSQAEQQQPPAKPEPQAAARQPQKSTASDPNKYVPYAGQDRGTKLSQARVLSAREIEIIELGGADP